MSIKLLSATIDRTKLAALTSDFETQKYLENLQRDLSGAVSSGIDDTQGIADQAQATADAAQVSAAAAQATGSAAASAANAAQLTANGAQTAATTAQSAATAAQSTATTALNLANVINVDYISKTAVAAQSVASTFQAPSFYVAGIKVVGARETGWTAGTGTPYKGAFAANTAYAASAAYTQSEATAAYAALTQANQRILALESAMRTHGLIN